MRMSSLDRLPHSFHAAGTNGRLDLSLPRCASCCPTNCPCSTWSGSCIAQFAKENVAPNQRSSAGWMPARTGKSSVGVGRKHLATMHKASLRMLSMRRVCILRHQIGAQYSARDVAAAPQTPQLGGPRPTLGAQVSLKLLFGYVTIFNSADLFTTDLNCRKKLACDIISECNVILSRRI